MYTIAKLWIDTLENKSDNAHGYKVIGYVETEEETEPYKKERMEKSKYPWPLDYFSYRGETETDVPVYMIEKLEKLS